MFGIALALENLAMSIGLIRTWTGTSCVLDRDRSELAHPAHRDGVTAGGLAFLGALLGTIAAYVGLAGSVRLEHVGGWPVGHHRSHPLEQPLLIIVAMPVVAAIVGWVLAGRDPTGISTRPME